MSRATQATRDLAERLIAHEDKANKIAGTAAPKSLIVLDQLRPHLANLMGSAGFNALLSRSLALANAEVEWLQQVQVASDGKLAGLDALEAKGDAHDFLEGRVVLLAQLFGLLIAFIGEKLTMQLVAEVWPNVPLNELIS